MLPATVRGLPFDHRVETLIVDRSDLALIIQPMLTAWGQLRKQIAGFDKAVRALVKSEPTCRYLMSVPGIGVLSVLTYVSMVEDAARRSSAGYRQTRSNRLAEGFRLQQTLSDRNEDWSVQAGH